MKFINAYILILCCMLFSPSSGKHVVFEIDDVLFEVRETESLKGVPGLSSLGEKMASEYTSNYLKLLASDGTYADQGLDDIKVMFRDMPVPALLKAFFLNKITNKQALELAMKIINAHASVFNPNRYIYHHAAKSGLDPEHEVSYMYPVKAAHKLVRALREGGHAVYIFSNKNTGTMENLIKGHKKLFVPFKRGNDYNIFISGKMKRLKPSVASYEEVLKYFDAEGIARDEVVFIESLKEYKDVAESLDAASILWSSDQVKSIWHQIVGE